MYQTELENVALSQLNAESAQELLKQSNVQELPQEFMAIAKDLISAREDTVAKIKLKRCEERLLVEEIEFLKQRINRYEISPEVLVQMRKCEIIFSEYERVYEEWKRTCEERERAREQRLCAMQQCHYLQVYSVDLHDYLNQNVLEALCKLDSIVTITDETKARTCFLKCLVDLWHFCVSRFRRQFGAHMKTVHADYTDKRKQLKELQTELENAVRLSNVLKKHIPTRTF
ncbi:hypothetical protein SJAG_04254 [Schizosaccharomyces japonicus yFS275]|uniref:Uncharacterized protein n=1 Tax=Schizosaccharomyces japonicus (strain yFS275 / FY16936) TaxID=402676 RepID=B6K6C5_SCHJY|nr:hypothetical protein SJAG_04254 [Schizosaccharomyces japonicus yFS275]EEB09079.1 hypothetical protein SJAG_04254 [Schizosaccharomyces japonicus yFS275]